MKGWAELKAAFQAATEGDPAERARHVAALAAIDPELPARLDALLAADAGAAGDLLQQIFEAGPESGARDRPARIGGYDVIDLLGAGGMGEVYRARDSRLQREVAIKILRAALATDRAWLARFEREAQVLASLNHPHIAQIYGFEDAGGVPALVMEFVEGPTLAQVLERDPDVRVSMPRALRIAWQVADGLAAAHEKGIVHRDLKPGNIVLTEQGHVKIVDFGVAKSLSGIATAPGGPAGGTEAGLLLGTPAYMSPEQARGLPIDRRTDIWAFGCVLCELLTGRGPFAGVTPSDSLAAVLEREPDLSRLPPDTPAPVRLLLRHCLQKDAGRRLRDIADARLAIEDALAGPADGRSGQEQEDATRETAPAGTFVRTRAPWILAGLGLLVLALLAGRLLDRPAPPAEARRIVTSLVLPRGLHLSGSGPVSTTAESRFAVSPDGRRLILVATDGSDRPQLWLRELGSSVFQPLAGTEEASFPFWAPDSESIGFVAAGRLRAIRVYGGEPVTLSETAFRTGSWSRSGTILFAPASRSPLYAVPASGGPPAQITTLDTASGEVQHSEPEFLPDGRHFLFVSYGTLTGGALDVRGVFVGSLDASTPPRLLVAGATQGRYANGHLLVVQGGTLMAQPFDLTALALGGAPQPLAEDVRLSTAGATGAAAGFSASDTGVLAYQAALRTESRPILFDRAGTALAELAPPADYGDVALSPDGSSLAVSVLDPARSTRDLWLYDTEGGSGQRLTSDPDDEFAPVWSPDGTRLLFSGRRNGLVDLFIKDMRSAADPMRFDADTVGQGRFATDWSRDGRFLMYIGGGRAIARSHLWVAPAGSSGQGRALLEAAFIQTHGHLGPSGDWFTYSSNETGRMEVYADRFPELGARQVVSVGGGGWARWSRDGTEIYYLSPGSDLMAVAVRATGARIALSAPQRLFGLRPRPPVRLDAYAWDVSPDGRFVVNTLSDEPESTVITIVLNWTAGLAGR